MVAASMQSKSHLFNMYFIHNACEKAVGFLLQIITTILIFWQTYPCQFEKKNLMLIFVFNLIFALNI